MTLIEMPDLEQGSEEWLAARRGIVTASVVGRLITVASPDATTVHCPRCHATPLTSCFSLTRKTPTAIKTIHSERSDAAGDMPPEITVAKGDDARTLTALLVAERITGRTEETYISNDMWRGRLVEPIARDTYSKHHAPVVKMGFMLREEKDWRLGFSPDGLVGEDGLIEIKAPRAKGHIRAILADEVPVQYMAQCQAGLLVSGRSWLDFVSFVGGMPLFVKRIEPDPKWHAAITAACIAFEVSAAQMAAEYAERIVGMPPTDRIDFEIKVA